MSFAKPLFVLLATVIAPLTGLAEQPRVDATSRLATFQEAGSHFFALSLQADPVGNYPLAESYEVAILVDTSATQTGSVRIEALEVLHEIAASLPVGTRTALLACDVDTLDLSGGLIETTDAKWETAVARLEKRIPLGTTNLGGALSAAAKLFSNASSQRTIVYLGDGINRANLLNKQQHRQLIDQLVESKITVNALAIGPVVDLASLAAIANQTGGIVLSRDAIAESTQAIGRHLAHASTMPVLWIEEARLPAELVSYFPQRFPPLRMDRDSVVVGQASSAVNAGTVSLTGTAAGQEVQLEWQVSAEASNPDMGFLAAVVNQASRDGGVTMPALGSEGLRAMSYMLADNATSLVKAGEFALKSGDLDSAVRIAEEALKQDPSNAEARSLLNAAKKLAEADSSAVPAGKFMQFGGDDPFAPAAGGSAPADPFAPTAPDAQPGATQPEAAPAAVPAFPETTPTPVPAAPVPPAAGSAFDPALLPVAPPPAFQSQPSLLDETLSSGDLLAEELARRQARAQAIDTDVRRSIRDAGEQLRLVPASAGEVVQGLKLLMERVDNFTDVDPALRSQLRSQIASALQNAALKEAQFIERISRSEAIKAQADQAERLLTETSRRDEALKQLVEQFNYLMEEHRYLEASKDVAPEVGRLAPETTIAIVTREVSSFAANYALVREAFKRREQGFVDAMRGVEEAAIPFAGDPPVVYPSPDVWQALTARRKERYAATSLGADGESERRITLALKQQVPDIAYNAMPLQQVIEGLADDMNIPIVLNVAEIELGGLADVDTPITLNLTPVSLRSVLRLMLDPLELTYIIKDEVLQITTKDNANEEPIRRVYPVGDLVVPIMAGGGMMGGMGGGMMGGMGGGMGGGMMGGMGGGMGGGMMGGMGGGMGGMGGGMGGMFAVPDDSRKSPTARAATTKPVAAPTTKPMAISHGSSSVDVSAWVAKFEVANEEQRAQLDAQVRQTVQDKIEVAQAFLEAKDVASAKGEFEKVIGLIGGLLGAGYPQPWMYQALSLGMEACDYPAAEIKRVLLSSLDFNGDANQALSVAEYLARKGMKKEALEILRDLATADPYRYEVFAAALPLAEELQDVDALRWVCVGVMSKVWPAEQAKLFDRASLAARATHLRLKQQGRVVESDIFAEQVKTALRRDLVVRVNWTGQADLDLKVMEPAGSVCSLTNPMTVSGGVLLGDTSSSNTKSSINGFSEIYACPQGYAGQYEVLIRRVWGEVSGGKATVEIYTDYGTAEQSYSIQQIDLSEKDALVHVEVKNGNRQEPLVDAQLANVRKKQIEVGQAVLGQFAGSDSSSGASLADNYATYRRLLAIAGNNAGGGLGFPFGRGAVGYRPVITVLPESAAISPSAVISADRRFVRISPNPFFSQIGEVLTYNTVDGSQGQNQGGSGTQGGFTGGGVGGGGGQQGGVF
jgi:tetratricopeptide (TPR) repeat protein